MNTENNILFQETQGKIIEAYGHLSLEKQLSRITVSDICRKAGIHRTTFYKHFQDVDDLSHYLQQRVYRNLMEMIAKEGEGRTRAGVHAQIQYFYKYRAIILRNLKNNPYYFFETSFFETELTENQKEGYKKLFQCASDWEMENHRAFFAAGTMEVIRRWILSGCEKSPDEIADLICKISLPE